MKPTEPTLAAIRAHAAQEFPRECCGLVVIRRGKQAYIPVRNIAEPRSDGTYADFLMHSEDQYAAEDQGEVAWVVHSHPNIPPTPTQADLVWCERGVKPWLIMNWPTGAYHIFEPSGYVPPLYGRNFFHGVLDCYTFIQQYYQQELTLTLPDFERPNDWWLKGQNLYLEGFEEAGFTRVDGKPRKHDVLLMRLASPVPNHGAVYLGDGLIGQHQMNRLSSRDVYGGWYEKITTHVLRHGSQM